MTNVLQPERTNDSRFQHHKLSTGEFEFYSMYRQNLRVEGDGLAYHELNLVRAILLDPILYVLMGCNMLIAFIDRAPLPRGGRVGYVLALITSHVVGLVCNILRCTLSIAIALVEIILWPFRICGGIILAPIGMFLCAGHIYALSCSMLHTFLRSAGPVVIRKVKVEIIHQRPRILNAGGFGTVHCYDTDTTAEASYIASTFKIKQRCGIGPECIWIRGRRVFVSSWYVINPTSMFTKRKKEWKVLDPSIMEWRVTRFHFQHRSDLKETEAPERDAEEGELSRNCADGDALRAARSRQQVQDEAGLWAFVQSFEELDVISNLDDLELYYNSLLGWNKYHWMSAEGNQIRVIRNDRRALSHLIAMMSSLLLYFQFRNSEGWFGLSIELYSVIIANYALITSYVGEILMGKASEVVDAKNDRYGVIVSRAIDRGYVRGFHVPNGGWIRYENRDASLALHEVQPTEVNVTCNSFVYESEVGPMIKVVSYNGHPPPFDLPWDPSETV